MYEGVRSFWGVLAKEVDPGACRHSDEDRISRDANENSLRLVTSRDSRIKFGIGATTRGYIFRVVRVCVKALSIPSP